MRMRWRRRKAIIRINLQGGFEVRFKDVLDAVRYAHKVSKETGKTTVIVERHGYVVVKNRRAVTESDRVLEVVRG